MIASLTCDRTSIALHYYIETNASKTSIGSAPLPLDSLLLDFFDYQAQRKYRLYYNPANTKWGASPAQRATYKILDHDTWIGHIAPASEPTNRFFQKYLYFNIYWQGAEYTAHVMQWQGGIMLCLYRGSETVAIAEYVPGAQQTGQDVDAAHGSYILYMQDEQDVIPTALFTIFFDLNSLPRLQEEPSRIKKRKPIFPSHEKTIEKFDPTFIPRVIALERGKESLPSVDISQN